MANKTLGYVLLAVGIIIAALSYASVRSALNISNFGLSDIYILVIGAAVLIVGAYLSFGSSRGKQQKEVPIYHGKNIVGYRRME